MSKINIMVGYLAHPEVLVEMPKLHTYLNKLNKYVPIPTQRSFKKL